MTWRIFSTASTPHSSSFKNLDTVEFSLPFSRIQVMATDNPGHTFKLSQYIRDGLSSHPLRDLGVEVTTPHLDGGTALKHSDDWSAVRELFRS